jgi:NACHT domain
MNDSSMLAKSKFSTLSALLGVAGWAILAVSAHGKLINTFAATIVGAIWTAFLGLTAGIWSRVEKTLVELAGGEIDVLLRDIFSGYRKRYQGHVRKRYGTFDVKGLVTQGPFSLQIEEVYVELAVAPKQAAKVSGHPLPNVTVTEGRHDLWTFLGYSQNGIPNLAILGAPGSGKTTLLKHLTVGLAARRGHHRLGVKRTPVLLFIRDHAAAIVADPEQTIIDVVNASTRKMNIPAPEGWFEREFNRGRCLVMLDGLDEIADATARKTVAEWVDDQMAAYDANPFLVTSRPFGYRSNPLSRVTVLEVCPFTLEQTERFIKQWYLANEAMSAQNPKTDEGVQIRAREGAEDLLKRLRDTPNLADLAVNPLLLTMIANVHRYRSSLPGRRVELYAEICEVFLGRRLQARGLDLELTPAQIKRALQPLALAMMQAEKRELTFAEVLHIIAAPLTLISTDMDSKEFIEMVQNRSGLLIEHESGIWGFAHLTFQEYLAASEVVEERLEKDLVRKVTESWWHETIRLYAALADATPIVEACISGEKPAIAQLTLAVECLDEARLVQPHLRRKVVELVDAGLEDPDPESARLAAETTMELRLRRLTRIDDECYIDTSLLSCAEYQLFIDARLAADEYRQPDHWPQTRYSIGSAREPVLGVRPSDAEAFCEWLTERRGGEWSFRIPDSGSSGSGQDASEKNSCWVGTPTGIKLLGATGTCSQLTSEMLRKRISADIKVGGMTIASGFDLENDLDRVLERVLERARSLERALDLDIYRVRDFDGVLEDLYSRLYRDFDRYPNLDPSPDRAPFLAPFLNPVQNRELYLYPDPDPDSFPGLDRVRDRSISRICLLSCISRCSDLHTVEKSHRFSFSWFFGSRHKSRLDMSTPIDRLLDSYIAIVLLEERIEGRFPAIEGIRILKVRNARSDVGLPS